MNFIWYSRILTHHPYIILITIFLLSSMSFIITISIQKFPDFSDPQLGFEARGTLLAQRIITWKNLIDSTSSKQYFIDNPLEYDHFQKTNVKHTTQHNVTNTILLKKNKSKKFNRIQNKNKNKMIYDKRYKINNTSISENGINLKNDSFVNISKNNNFKNESGNKQSHFNYNTDEFFCNLPNTEYARVVISSKDQLKNLWSIDNVLAQCHLDAMLRKNSHFSLLCQRRLEYKKKCCRSWYPANYIALLSNKTSCLAVTETDIQNVKKLLQMCSYFYQNFELTFDCAEDLKCQSQVPTRCYSYNAVYYLLHYLLDNDFIVDINNNNSILNSVMMILPIAASSASLDYYNDINIPHINYKSLYISAVQFGLKNTVFDQMLISDSFLIFFGFGLITICVWFYTQSFLITISTVLVIIFSLIISYAIYTVALKITFFPFMNLLTVIVAVGIGADDAFIFCKIWKYNKKKKSINKNNDLIFLVHETMIHAIPSMFVTTLTTSIAFFASVISNVTAINCFSLFSGIIVIINFLLMLTWLPASVITAEYYNTQIIIPRFFFIRKVMKSLQIYFDTVTYSLINVLILIVISLKWLLFIVFFILGLASCGIIFKFPGLQLPDSQEFQLFDISHLFEQYDLIYTKHFRFESIKQDNNGLLPLRFVWGILPIDNGNYLNPESKGDLVIDNNFNMSDPESQIWLDNFCKNLRLQPFYQNTPGPLLPNCFIESLRHWMNRRCEDPIDSKLDRSPCCECSIFPYKPNVLNHCTAEAIAEIYRTPSYLWNFKSAKSLKTAGVKFVHQNNTNIFNMHTNNNSLTLTKVKIQIVIVEYDSNIPFSISFQEMNKFFNQIEKWMITQLSTAPHGMKNGWFVSDLEFYELQRTLYEGTLWSVLISMILALIVLAFVTLNPIISFYAILSVGATISITIAGLIVLGWKLNILESIAISTAIGLAVDFNLHYGVSYRLNIGNNRDERIKIAIEQMSGPTLMAALTTGAAGALMLPSQILPYIQIGVFLILIMGVSWIYATFFLCPLLCIGGPSKFIQFDFLRFKLVSTNTKMKIKEETYKFTELTTKEAKFIETLNEEIISNINSECSFHPDTLLAECSRSIHKADVHHSMDTNIF